MSSDDWWSLGSVALGIALGSYVGYRLSAARGTRARGDRPEQAGAAGSPLLRAILPALGAFLGVAVAEDAGRLLLGHAKPGFALVKYLFAAATWVTQVAHLRRRARAAPP